MKYIMIFLIIGLLLISACSKGTIDARPIDAKVIEVDVNVKGDLCDDVTCNQNSYCVSGECVCNDDYKACNNICIPDSACCSSSECELGEFCENNICIKHVCPYNQIYYPDKERCDCDSDSKWCREQNQCIPKENCCVHADCGNDYACANTFYIASVCLDDGRKRCRSTLEGNEVRFYSSDISYEITVTSVSEDFVSLKINDLELEAQPVNVPYDLNDATVFIESTKMAGGVCKKV